MEMSSCPLSVKILADLCRFSVSLNFFLPVLSVVSNISHPLPVASRLTPFRPSEWLHSVVVVIARSD